MKKMASVHQYWLKLAFSGDLDESSPSARMPTAQLSPLLSASLSYEPNFQSHREDFIQGLLAIVEAGSTLPRNNSQENSLDLQCN